MTHSTVCRKELFAIINITFNGLIIKDRGWVITPCPDVSYECIDLGITQRTECRHNTTGATMTDGVKKKSIIDIIQEGRQRQWNTHATLTIHTMTDHTVITI
jgi:hypothetical protein